MSIRHTASFTYARASTHPIPTGLLASTCRRSPQGQNPVRDAFPPVCGEGFRRAKAFPKAACIDVVAGGREELPRTEPSAERSSGTGGAESAGGRAPGRRDEVDLAVKQNSNGSDGVILGLFRWLQVRAIKAASYWSPGVLPPSQV